MQGKRGAEHFGLAVKESEAAQAGRTVKAQLKRLRWGEKDFPVRRKWDPVKEEFPGDEHANRFLDRARREPWSI